MCSEFRVSNSGSTAKVKEVVCVCVCVCVCVVANRRKEVTVLEESLF